MLRLLAVVSLATTAIGNSPVGAEPLFPSSVTGTDIDFIRSDDPAPAHCVNSIGSDRAEMPDKRTDQLFVDGVEVYEIVFADGTQTNMLVHPDFEPDEGRTLVDAIAPTLARLPTFMRRRLSHIVLHEGDETAFAEADGGFFVLYSDNVQKRIADRNLEETLFHEGVHATLDAEILGSAQWVTAQEQDGAFVTRYARDVPHKEDLAETALFAYALRTPGRLPPAIEETLRERFPARLEVLNAIFDRHEPLMRGVGEPVGCD